MESVRRASLTGAQGAALAILLAVMLATRLPIFAGFLHLQDASWAVFFLAGFYLRELWRWVFPTFIAMAVAIDLVAIGSMGVPNYCLTVAYWFVVPGYGSLWLGGAWLASRATPGLLGAGRALAALLVSASLCFFITNASFYWIGERVTAPTWDGWVANFTRWYWPFVRTTVAFAGAALLVHLGLSAQARRSIAKQ